MMARLLADSRVADQTAFIRGNPRRSGLSVPHLPIEDEVLLIQILERNGFQKIFNTLGFAVVSQEYELEHVGQALIDHNEPEGADLLEQSATWEQFRKVMALLLIPRVPLEEPVDVDKDPKNEACRIILGEPLDKLPMGDMEGDDIWDEHDLRAAMQEGG